MERAAEIRKGLMCAICVDFLRDAYNVPCGHTFCRECIGDALAKENSCPTCLNPAWKKDTQKMALADSAVHDWVTNCEAAYQAHTARRAARGGGDSSDTESEFELNGASSGDDGGLRQPDADGEDGENNADEDEDEEEPEMCAIPTAASPRQGTVTPRERKDEDIVAAAGAGAGAASVKEGAFHHPTGRGMREAAALHGARHKGTPTAGEATPSSDAKPTMADSGRSAGGGQEKENVAGPTCGPSAGGDGAASPATAVASADAAAAAASSVRVVGVKRARVWGTPSFSSSYPSGQNNAPRVRFQSSPLGAGAGSEAGPKAKGRRLGESSGVSAGRRELSQAIAGGNVADASQLPVGGARDAWEEGARIGKAARAREMSEVPRLEQDDGSSGAVSPQGLPTAELRCRGGSPSRRVPDSVCEDTRVLPPSSPAAAAEVEGETTAAQGEEEPSGFAVALPDTCDIVDAELTPPCSSIATTTAARMMLFTPPTLRVGREEMAAPATAAGAATAAASSGRGSAMLGRWGADEEGTEASSARSTRPAASEQGIQRSLEGRSGWLAAGSVSYDRGGGGEQQQSQSRGRGESTPPARSPKSKAETRNILVAEGEGRDSVGCPAEGACGSASEDEDLDAESVSLWGIDENKQQQRRQQQQVDPRSATLPLLKPSPRASEISAAGHGVGSSKRLGEMDEPFAGGDGGEGADEESEETCDETDSAAVARERPAGGEQPTAGLSTPLEEREDRGIGGEGGAAEDVVPPADGDEVAQLRSAEADSLPSGPHIRGGDPRGAEVAERFLSAEKSEENAVEPSSRGVKADAGLVVALETAVGSVSATQAPEGSAGESFAGGIANGASARGLPQAAGSCLALADALEEVWKDGGGAAPSNDGAEAGMRAISACASVAAADITAAQVEGGSGSSTLSQAALIQDGLEVHEPGSRGDQRRQALEGGERDSPRPTPGGISGGHAEDNRVEARETSPWHGIDKSAEAYAGGLSRPLKTMCSAKQELPEEDEFRRPSNPGPGSHSATSQEVQSLTTQEVPETAGVWGSAAEFGGSSSQAEGAAALPTLASCPESKVLETGCLQGEPSPRKAVSAGAGAGDEGGDFAEQRSTHARRWTLAMQRQIQEMGAPSPLPSPPASVLTEVVAGDAENDRGEAQKHVGLGGIERLGEAVADPRSLRTGAPATGPPGAADERGSAEGARKVPGSGIGKRPAGPATPSPSKIYGDPGSAAKQSKPTPPSDAGDARCVPIPDAATGDEEASSSDGQLERSRRMEQGVEESREDQGPQMALRGGSGACEGDGASEAPEADHDLAAAQDAWHAEGGYEFGDKAGFEGHEGAFEAEAGRSATLSKSKAVVNPYVKTVPINMHDDGSEEGGSATGASGTKLPPADRARPVAVPTGAGLIAKGQSRRAAFRRPDKSQMGFSGRGIAAVAPSGLGNSSLVARLKEMHYRQASNKILGAGREHGLDGTASAKTPEGKTGSWSTYDMGPDTQEVIELQARVNNKQGPAMESSPLVTINLNDDEGDDDDDDDDDDDCCRNQVDTQVRTSTEKRKRPAVAAAAAEPPASKGERKGPGQATNRRPVAVNSSRTGESGGHRRRHRCRRRPVVVLLGCSQRELKRAKLLCKRLGSREPETELVSDSTHVVIGAEHTSARYSSGSGAGVGVGGAGGGGGGGGGSDGGTEEGRGSLPRRRHELVTHEPKGFREAVMLGLWVLDFSWVEESLQRGAGRAGDDSSSRAGDECDEDEGEGRGAAASLLPLAPTRDHELLGCCDRHEGCEPRRGRFKKGARAPGVFAEVAFVLVSAAGPPKPSSSSDLERVRSETERLVRIGGGAVSVEHIPPTRAQEGYRDDPFGADGDDGDGLGSDAEVVAVDPRESGGGTGGGSAAAAAAVVAKRRWTVVLSLPDRHDEHCSASLAKAAAEKRKKLGADAVVDRAWVLRSVERSSPVPFSDGDLNGTRPTGGGDGDGGSSGSSCTRRTGSKSLRMPQGGTSRCEVVLDLGKKGERRTAQLDAARANAIRAERQRTARILQKADEVAEAPLLQKLPPLEPRGLGEDGFEFVRRGSKQAPVKANYTTYTAQNKAQRDLIDALNKAGYLDLDCSEEDRDEERRLGEFWFDFVYDGFFMKRSELAIPEAKRRGCPVDVLISEYECHESIQSGPSRARLGRLPGEFAVWKAGRGSEDAFELL